MSTLITKPKKVKVGTLISENVYLKAKEKCKKMNVSLNAAIEYGLEKFLELKEKKDE